MQLHRENYPAPSLGARPDGVSGLAARSLAMRRICDQLQQVAQRIRLALIEGEAGTGKHLLARHIYGLKPAQGKFIAEEAADLFPAEERSLPGEGLPATRLPGARLQEAMERAAQGLLLLRNIDELELAAQAQLLRLIRSFETTLAQNTGSLGPAPLQLVCTARQPLRALAVGGKFLPEIYYRLSALRFTVPPLRDRKEDIPALVQMFVEAVSREHQKLLRGLGPGAYAILMRHRWPGNVRELESVIRAACLAAEGQWVRPIDLAILPLETATRPEGEARPPQDFNLDGVVRRHIQQVLKSCDGNKARTAAKLGISRSTLYRMLESDSSSPLAVPSPRASGGSALATSPSDERKTN